ncbi:hypothetical protein OG422_31435 (plasmid) [Streptomyces sp. NBC_01525]|uniref:restriction endonuclease fold toxin-2 domain-containing protein n=1 Tax=Streptomyces sp. NBC_01525 TaxID=2903893 RepID=UPI002F919BF2
MAMNYIRTDADVSASMMKPQQLPASADPQCSSEPRAVDIPTTVGRANWTVREIIATFWPQGDPDKLRQAARDWQHVGELITVGASDAVAAGGEAALIAEAGAAAAAMTAEVEASAELAVLAEAAAVVDSAAARIVIPAATTAAMTLAATPAAASTPTPAGGLPPLPRSPNSAFPPLSPAGQQQMHGWMSQMDADGRTSPAVQPTGKKPKVDARRAYQIRVAGSTEYNLYTPVTTDSGRERGMNADGVRAEDGAAIDAKYIGQQKSCRSPLRVGNIDNVPDFVYESTMKSQEDEARRYAEAFKDPRNKVNHLEVITNDEKAGAYYDAMLAAEHVPGETRIEK